MTHIRNSFVFFLLFLCFAALLSPPVAIAGITLTDAAGKTLVLAKQPARIVVAGAAPFIPLHMLYLFQEAKERLSGFEVKYNMKDDFLRLIDPDFALKKTLDTNPGPESVAALKPDLVIIKATQESALAKSLNALGIQVMHVAPETPEMFFSDIRNLGKIFGNEARANQITGYYQDKLALIQGCVGGLSAKEKSRILVLEYNNRGNHLSLNVPARGWFQSQQAIISGGNPVWLDALSVQDGWQVTGFEQVAAWNPDKIFLIVWYQLNGPDVVRSLYEDTKWSRLSALKKKRCIFSPRIYSVGIQQAPGGSLELYGWPK